MDKIDFAKFNAAMEKACGNRTVAGALLRLTPDQVHERIKSSPELMRRWGSQQAITTKSQETTTDAAGVSRHNDLIEPGEMTEEEKELFKAMLKEDAILQDGLSKLKMSDEEVALAVSLAKFQQNSFVGSVAIISAGNTRMSILLQTLIDKQIKRLDQVRELLNQEPWCNGPSEEREMLVREEAFLMDKMIAMAGELRMNAGTSQRGATLMAMVQYRLKHGKGRSNGKPGFRPKELGNTVVEGPGVLSADPAVA